MNSIFSPLLKKMRGGGRRRGMAVKSRLLIVAFQ